MHTEKNTKKASQHLPALWGVIFERHSTIETVRATKYTLLKSSRGVNRKYSLSTNSIVWLHRFIISSTLVTCAVMTTGTELFTCNSVEEHEVLKVGDLSPLPALRHVGRLEELTRCRQGNPPGTQTHRLKLISFLSRH